MTLKTSKGNARNSSMRPSSTQEINTVLAVAVFCVAVVFGGCSRPAVNTDKNLGAMNVDVPRDMDHASDDPAIAADTSRVISILPSAEWYIGKRGFSDKYAFRDNIAEYVKNDPGKTIFFQASANGAYGQLA